MQAASETLTEAQRLFNAARHEESLTLASGLIAEWSGPEAAALLADNLAALGLKAEAAEAYRFAAARTSGAEAALLTAQAAVCTLERFDAFPGNAQTLFPSPAERDAALAALIDSSDEAHLALARQHLDADERNPLILALYRRLRRDKPQDQHIRMNLLRLAREHCDYPILLAEMPLLEADITAGRLDFLNAEPPHANIMWLADERLNRLATAHGGKRPISANARAARHQRPQPWGRKIRLGYLSCDLWDDHATMRLLRSVLEAHDRERFEVTLFCYTPAHLLAFDQGGRQQWQPIVSIDGLDDEAAAREIQGRSIDILIDLKGHTRGSRSDLMNLPLAPLHVQWLGFPGSCPDIDCDYVIGDRFVLPDSAKPFYHEHFCRLPESYQPNDPVHRPLPPAPSRLALGLPENRVVIAAFNSQRKNTLETMALWAEVLKQNPQALLWLMVDGQHARQATAEHFKRLGVKQSQFLFAPKMAYSAHIARMQAADFAIDTFPCNGHTTTSDMLWAGLPVITRRGSNFASRVSESLLNAAGLQTLVAEDDAAFLALAAALIADASRRTALKQHLTENRYRLPLFDAVRFCRHLENAYEMMVERAKAGLQPGHFDVPALPA
ncbi:O-linked N-acetylglucosamine transferase, SPINDLY family protein [Rhizobium paknamense]|uniref:O-linked N-acetylglucosamine transferase (SPINDLY family) n=1 Tax=Rhizobium paknamense TaxID=1206817 RepID=A0ABU0I6D1_9HYPH|nr:hypothetical protein [Rhizobium paknamense]MDQ0453780.1 putative O-linked N-acetylglucosamine transferase (SPINDLY family) [Rhizobium paknamense]